MKNIDHWFILMALVYALLGMSLGFWMGASEDMTHVPVHAHINLVGWVSMTLFALIYRSFPALKDSRLAAPHFWLMAIGTPIMLAGIPLAHSGKSPLLAIGGSALVILAFVLFLVNFVRRGT